MLHALFGTMIGALGIKIVDWKTGWKKVDATKFRDPQRTVISNIATDLDILKKRADDYPIHYFTLDGAEEKLKPKGSVDLFDANRPLPGKAAWAVVTIISGPCQATTGVGDKVETPVLFVCDGGATPYAPPIGSLKLKMAEDSLVLTGQPNYPTRVRGFVITQAL